MNNYIDITRAAKQLGCTERHVQRMCTAGSLAGAIKSSNRWKIPVTADVKLFRPSRQLGADELADIPVGKRNEALRRAGLIQKFEKEASSYVTAGGNRGDALAVFASQNKTTKRSLERWLQRFRAEGLVGLVDSRGGGKFISQMIDAEAMELFKSMYLTQQQLSIKTCWQNIHFVNKDQRCEWKIPTLPCMYRYIKQHIPLSVLVLHREGIAAYEARCAPYIEADPDSIEPGQIFVGDHHQLNCWIRHRNKWIRPWLTAWEDMRSRTIVGFSISPSPNQTTILLAMKRAIEKYGPPDSVKIDNGRDYDSELWTGTTKVKRRALAAGYIDEQIVAGIYAMMDIGVSFAIPYHPQSKLIERFFDTLDRQFTKTIPTYCGKDSDRKPDYLKDLLKNEKAIMTAYNLESFTNMAGKYIEDVYNQSAHSGRGMEGRTPLEVLTSRSSRRVMAEGVLDLLLRVWSRELVVGKNGVNFKKMWYGQFNTELAIHQGRKVRVAYDPDDLRMVYVYDATTLKLLTIAEQNQLIQYGSAVSEENFREATRQKSRAIKIARQFRDSRLTANMDLTSLTIKAMQEATEDKRQNAEDSSQESEYKRQKTLRPVKTAMDGQVKEHKRLEAVKAVKKAAGAESVVKVIDIDLSVLSPTPRIRMKLFDE